MIWWIGLLFLVGLALSAFFSGSETGFYRIPRARLLIDALSGDWSARALLQLTNHPSLFVATTLVGNNLANYFASAAVVIATDQLISGSAAAQILAAIAVAPVLFVYGELLPKKLFLTMPNRLLRRSGPLFLVFAVVFLPVSAVLWALAKVLEGILGESPQKLQRRLARAELRRVLEEGHEVGILRPSQRAMAQGIFAVANRPVTEFAVAPVHLSGSREGVNRRAALEFARRHKCDIMPVAAPEDPSQLLGYVRAAELYLNESATEVPLRPLLDVPDDSMHLTVLMQMQDAQEPLARVVRADGDTVGIVTIEHLCEPLFRRDE